MKEPNTFCHAVPPDRDSPHAIKLHISKASKMALGAIPKGAEHIMDGIIAFDQISRKYYAIRHYPCFADSYECCCAAQAQEVKGPKSKVKWESIEFLDADEEGED